MFAAQNGHRDVIKILLKSTSCNHYIKDKVSSLEGGVQRLDTITCAQKVGVSPHIQHCTKCKSRSKALKTVLKVKVS